MRRPSAHPSMRETVCRSTPDTSAMTCSRAVASFRKNARRGQRRSTLVNGGQPPSTSHETRLANATSHAPPARVAPSAGRWRKSARRRSDIFGHFRTFSDLRLMTIPSNPTTPPAPPDRAATPRNTSQLSSMITRRRMPMLAAPSSEMPRRPRTSSYHPAPNISAKFREKWSVAIDRM
jgi:hypothetical protein